MLSEDEFRYLVGTSEQVIGQLDSTAIWYGIRFHGKSSQLLLKGPALLREGIPVPVGRALS